MTSLLPDQLDALCDSRGFLKDWQQWNREIALSLARLENIDLSEAHWEILHLLRGYFEQFEASPANRALVNWVKRHAGPDKGNSIYLMTLFPGSPARVGSRIAGLPKPKNCL